MGNSYIISYAAKKFDILITSSSVLHNYFESWTKLFSHLFEFFRVESLKRHENSVLKARLSFQFLRATFHSSDSDIYF